jgi:hypothetical protein
MDEVKALLARGFCRTFGYEEMVRDEVRDEVRDKDAPGPASGPGGVGGI